MPSTSALSLDHAAAAYGRDGFWIQPCVLDGSECEELKAEALRVLRKHAKPEATVHVGVAASSLIYRCLASDSRIVSVLERLMADGVMFMSDKFVFKSGRHRFATPWHIDAAYWPNTRPKISVWIPLDDASAANGTLKVVRGSHLREWKSRKGDVSLTNQEFENVVDEGQWLPGEEVVCDIPRGTAVYFSDRLLHASCENTAGQDRYAIISTYHAPEPEEAFDLRFPARQVIVPKGMCARA